MDYLLLSSLVGVAAAIMLFSYDIACQFSRKFKTRLESYPRRLQINKDVEIRWAIPKKHFPCHGPKHSKYSLNFLRYVGRTVREGCEVAWSHINPVALSTREMAPSFRREVLDAHWASWNWQKTVHMGIISGLLHMVLVC